MFSYFSYFRTNKSLKEQLRIKHEFYAGLIAEKNNEITGLKIKVDQLTSEIEDLKEKIKINN